MIEMNVETTSHDRAEDGWYLPRKLTGYRTPNVRTLYRIRVVK